MKFLKSITFLFMTAGLLLSCSDDDDGGTNNDPIGDQKIYSLMEMSDSGVSGTATFQEQSNGATLITLDVDGTPTNGMHPSHIHMNTAAEGGDIVVTLNEVDGETGMSETLVSATNSGEMLSFEDLLAFDGYINIHLSADDLATVVAQGDIGQNELTGEMKSYNLETRDVDGISGTVMFEERVNGEAEATIMLDGTPAGGMHPAHIHMNTAAESGAILYTFTPVNGDTGMSRSNVAMLDDDTSFGYSDVLDVDGYVNVHLSADELGTIVAQGDIGQNELTGESITYTLGERDVPGISGTVMFQERVNGEAEATIMLDGTPPGGMHPAHIHMNTAAEGGDIIYTFTPVNGDTGMSRSNVAMLDDNSSFGYSDVLDVDGYVNVHLSADELGVIVAQGNIGMNAM
ncbi:CHRD domain-containing protein [Psychroflexus aestuariivivens]|uniref:CHRD domain-containing protein n=1 Tax=Psychroflexus aestuariivivens TaxID=1795040 RepID=UPI000FD9110C|nr:CHRD domain-containing protein [Psychroflexus aestuariivivens]